jgi:malate dehydrogenase
MKLAIIGGSGLLGSTTAFLTAQKGIFDEIKLLGRRKNLLTNHSMDMEHAIVSSSKTKVTVADYEDIGDCDVIIVTASAPEREVISRDEYLKDNIKVVEEVAEKINKYNNHAIIITATNPIDVFNYYLYKKLNRDRMKMLGFASNDSLRLRWALSKELNLDINKLEAYCIGEHGEGQLPLINYVKYDGKTLILNSELLSKIKNNLISWFKEFQSLNAKRTSGWTSAVNLTELVEAIALDSKKVIECSVPLEGELGYADLSLGMMVHIGKDGVSEITVPNLTTEEKNELDTTVNKIKKQIKIIL